MPWTEDQEGDDEAIDPTSPNSITSDSSEEEQDGQSYFVRSIHGF